MLYTPQSRRRFVQGSATTGLLFSAPNILKAADDSRRLKVALIGCGGRGTGAASNALNADSNAELWAVGDVSTSSISSSLKILGEKYKDRAQVPAERQMTGLDAYQKVLETNPDVVILTTPPGFRPGHLAAAIEAGKHVFCEKPVAVDPEGIRRAAFDQVHNGAIGDITSIYATYHTGPVKPMPPASERKPEWSDVEWQVRNWYNFSWLGGDGLVEQAVHSVDKTCWALKDIDPISAVANGGRQVPAKGGNIFDHFSVVYEYPGNVQVTLASRQIPNCFNENADVIRGTKGTLLINGGRVQIIGEKNWSYSEEQAEQDRDMYDQEHVELFESIRKGQAKNDGEWMAHSSLVAIMGRMSAYTGKKVSWKHMLESKEDLAPEATLNWGDSFTPHALPEPGNYKLV
jgi:predicted dehydrogenase